MKEIFINRYKNITIGRDKTNVICINDKSVSAHHAMIKKEDNRTQIIDNNSTNGTYVNEHKVSMHDIKIGDAVKVGDVMFRYQKDKLIFDSEKIDIKNGQIYQNVSEQRVPFFSISTGFCSIGREAGCMLTFNDQTVSRNHAMIKKHGNDYVIIDNNSTHGTFVNGNKISTTTLKNNDQIKIGENIFFFANGNLYNNMPNAPTFMRTMSETPKNKKYHSTTKIKKKRKRKSNKLKRGALIAAALVFVLLITIVISSFDNTKSLARFDELDEKNTPSIGEMAFASPYYYVDNGRDTGLNKEYAQYMSVLIRDTVMATDLIMEKYEQAKSSTDGLYNLVMETGSLCDQQFGTNYLGEADALAQVNAWKNGAELNEQIYNTVRIKRYDTDMAFADAVAIKVFTSAQAQRAVYEEFMLLSSMGATLYNNHLGGAPHEINDDLEKIKDIVSDDKIYKNFNSMMSCTESIYHILRYKESADIEVAIENLEDTLVRENYIIRDLQEAQKSGKFSNGDIMDVAKKSAFIIGMSESLLETLKAAQSNYLMEYENSYLAIDDFSLLTKAHAAGNSNFGKSIDVKASAKKAREGSLGSKMWDAVTSAGSTTWKYGTAAGRGILQVPADATYYFSSQVAISFLSGKEKEYRIDLVNKKMKEKYDNYFDVDKIGIEAVDSINNTMDAVANKGKEYGGYVGAIIDDTIHEVTKATTGGDPKIRPMEWIGTQVGDVLSGTITGVSGSTAKLLDPKSTMGDLLKAGVDLGLAFSGAKGGKASDIFGIFDSVEILKGYATGQATNLAKDATNGMIAAVDDIESGTQVADNPNQSVGDFNIDVSKTSAYFGEQIVLSVNEITDAEYVWYLDDADENIIRAGNSITAYYLSEGYHYPKVEIFDKDGKLLGSATTDMLIERYDLDIRCSNVNPSIGETVQFTVSNNAIDFDEVQIGWDMGDGKSTMGGASKKCSYYQPGNYTITAVAFKTFGNAGDIAVGVVQMTIEVKQLQNEFELIVSKTNVQVGEEISFSAEPWLERTRYIWVIGGDIYEGAQVNHAYYNAGTDTVELEVYNENEDKIFEDRVVITVDGQETDTPVTPAPDEPTPATPTPDENELPLLEGVFKSIQSDSKVKLYPDGTITNQYTNADPDTLERYKYEFYSTEGEDVLYRIVYPNSGYTFTVHKGDISSNEIISFSDGKWIKQ